MKAPGQETPYSASETDFQKTVREAFQTFRKPLEKWESPPDPSTVHSSMIGRIGVEPHKSTLLNTWTPKRNLAEVLFRTEPRVLAEIERLAKDRIPTDKVIEVCWERWTDLRAACEIRAKLMQGVK